MLTDKNTGIAYEFRVYQEKDLSFLKAKNEKKKLIIDFNMKDLELEYDYATDLDQLHSAKKMLW
jgi:capsule polysaccharide export protein KpsC/LpsZ